MKKLLQIVFGGLAPSYLIKQYVFGGIMYVLMLYANGASPIHKTGIYLSYSIPCPLSVCYVCL